ncbi:S-adenosylmethionine-dependent nucleotide dehydratase RSAD2-like isoform X2 [Ylistrum balloti]|uniref:S-adenosylmethionine-dependent nucleotide dehydratase RSAD2-like isoform X2 n=1 Tax=Ylistrum balloti TaxID=509963 RepID=UPI0029058FFC|nr:S-adenosylmethionine-dependent nucleotide dehydratase RSAD2-like isoform X2 [Ylistrum balloti]
MTFTEFFRNEDSGCYQKYFSITLAILVVVSCIVFSKRKEDKHKLSKQNNNQHVPEDQNGGPLIETSANEQKICNQKRSDTPKVEVVTPVPLSVNYHFTRQCNYQCGFCFHTAKTSAVLPVSEAKRGLRMLKESGMEKVNFSGGEPFIVQRGTYVGELVTFCKRDLGLPSVTIVSNGSLITEKWFKKYGEYLDILAISCDSFHPQVNKEIGRYQGSKNHLQSLQTVRDLCTLYKVAFKINTVVNSCNKDEDMTENILSLSPCRWKVFQCLLIGGENAGENALRQAETFVVTEAEFQAFLDRHSSVACLVPESNEKMRNSYLILDEYMRFLDCTRGGKDPSKSILDVGVADALMFSGFDESMFFKRGGKYKWSKADMKLEW